MTSTHSHIQRILTTHMVPIVITLIALVISILGDSAAEALRYEAPLIRDGEVWRLISGHFAHLGWSHFVLNIMGLALIWGLFYPTFSTTAWALITVISGIFISACMLWLNPHLIWYVGLSGVLHGMFVAGAVGGIRQGEWREAILLAAIVGKLIWEQVYGELPGTSDMAGGPVIVDAHLYGAIAGAMLALIFKPRMWCESAPS